MLIGTRRVGLLAAVGAATMGCALAGAPVASALVSYQWTGGGADSNWSTAANWLPAQSFQAGQSYAALDFAPGGSCVDAASAGSCFASNDDVPVSVGEISLDDNLPYRITASNSAAVTLVGSAPGGAASSSLGLDVTPGAEGYTGAKPEISLPIQIPGASAQTWSIAADGSSDAQSLEVDSIATQSPLDVSFTNEASLATKSLTGTQPLGVSGTGVLSLNGGSGSALDPGATISLTNDASVDISTGGTASVGAIDFADANGGQLQIGSAQAPDTVLTADGVTFHGGIDFLQMSLDSSCAASACTPGADNSELVSPGTINLAGSTLALNQGSDSKGFCDDLAVGQTYTLISAASITSYPFANFPEGAARPLAELCGLAGAATPTYVSLHYTSTNVTATVTAVGNAGDIPQNTGAAPAITDKSTSGSSIVAGDTLFVTRGTWNESNSTDPQTKLSYAYAWLRCPTSGACSPISGQSGSSYATSASDVGDTIYAEVTATNTLGSKQVSSAKVGPIVSVIAPSASVAPRISGSATLGSTLSVASSGTWAARPSASFSYQWLLCSAASASSCTVAGKAGSAKTLVLSAAALGKYVAVQVIASNRGGTTLATSNLEGRVVPTAGSILQALVRLRHPPESRRAIRTLIRRRSFTTSFASPSGGELRIVWRTRVTIGKGVSRRRRLITVASGTRTYANLGIGSITVHLSRYGRTLLIHGWRGHLITATESFRPLGGSWTVYTTRFTL